MGDPLSLAWLAGIVASIVLLGAWLAAWWQPRQRDVFRLTFPRSVSTAEVTAALRSLTGLLPPWHQRFVGSPSVVLEALASSDGITHRLLVDHRYAPYVTGQFRAAIPGLRIEPSTDGAVQQPDLAREFRVTGQGRLRASDGVPLSTGVLGALQPLRAGEHATVQWVIAPAASRPDLTWLRHFVASVFGESADAPPENVRRKPDEPELHAAGRVGISAGSPGRRGALARQVSGSFHAAGTADASLRRRLVPSRLVARRIATAQPPAFAYPATLHADELAAVVGIPLDSPQLPGLTFVEARDLPPVPTIPRTGRVLGHAKHDPKRPVAVGVTDTNSQSS